MCHQISRGRRMRPLPPQHPPRSQLTSQEEQQLPQALLVELQGVTVVFAFLLLQETPGGPAAAGGGYAGSLPTQGERGPPQIQHSP